MRVQQRRDTEAWAPDRLTHGARGRLLRLPLQDHPHRRHQRGQDLPGAELQERPVLREAAEHHRRGLHRPHAQHRWTQSQGQRSPPLNLQMKTDDK